MCLRIKGASRREVWDGGCKDCACQEYSHSSGGDTGEHFQDELEEGH